MASFFDSEYTSVLQKLVREVVNDPDTYVGSRYLPSVAQPAETVRVEVLEATGGLTNEHEIGTDPQYIQPGGSRSFEYTPPAYKESIHWDERQILYLRKLGSGDPSQRGIRQYISNAVDRLNRRIEARIEKLRWDAIFNGGFTYMGKTISFGIPGTNQFTQRGAVWSSNGIDANNTANPLKDLRYLLSGGSAVAGRYKFRRMVMNPNTARFMMDNTNVQSLIQYRFASDRLDNYEINKMMAFLLPGLPEVEVYDGWYQPETIVGGKVTMGDRIYFIPDGKIFLEPSNLPDGDNLGEFVQGMQLATGTIDDPGYGKFLVIEDNTASGTRGGPRNPYIDIIGGVYGGPKLDRPFDVMTLTVV